MKKIKHIFLLISLSFCIAAFLCMTELFSYFLLMFSKDDKQYNFAVYSIQHESNPLNMDIQCFIDLYDKLVSNQRDNYIYYEIYSQYLENNKEKSCFYSVETGELTDSCFAVNCVQINENIIRDCNISISQGDIFTQNDYKYKEGKAIPILLGSGYSALYHLGDYFYFNYLFDEYLFEVIGFLNEGSCIEISDNIIPLDKYIIMPSFEITDNVSITDGLKIHYANKTSGVVMLDMNNANYFHSFIKPALSSANAGTYSWIAFPRKLQFKEFFGIDFGVFQIIISLVCLILTILAALIIYKFPNPTADNNPRNKLYMLLYVAAIFIITCVFYCFINIIYIIFLGIITIRNFHFIIIGCASIVAAFLCTHKKQRREDE